MTTNSPMCLDIARVRHAERIRRAERWRRVEQTRTETVHSSAARIERRFSFVRRAHSRPSGG